MIMLKELLARLFPNQKPQPNHHEIIKAFREGKPLRSLKAKKKGGV